MISIALLGLGRMGRNHLRAIQADTRFTLVAVVDPVTIEPAADVLRGAPFLRDTAALPRLDAAVVATPTATHAELAARLLDAGVPVLVEKPLAATFAQCRALLGKGCLVVGHVERFNPAVRAIRRILNPPPPPTVDEARMALGFAPLGPERSTDIGRPIHFVSTRIGGYPGAASPEHNVALDLAVHDLDILRMLVGPLRVEASACHSTTDPNVCDTAEILLSSQHGASATVHVDWIAPTKVRTLRVTGTKGAAFVDYIAQTCAVVRGDAREELPVERREPLRAQLDAFHEFVTTGKRGLLCSGEDAAAAVLLAERALAVSRGAWV